MPGRDSNQQFPIQLQAYHCDTATHELFTTDTLQQETLGSRDWTKEEMTAYLDWNSSENDRVDNVVAQDIGSNPVEIGRRGVRVGHAYIIPAGTRGIDKFAGTREPIGPHMTTSAESALGAR
ncbi:hypothetical protein PoMZ_00003 [Pyricularia oryzae]|uniref:Uncharacterized protein n=1 Tax=Pyricularia oryzae TaxID=318829 RepID=A0A4P7N2D1_PYROR|nr:hypothetical protein PoMZ_00003 [Pyricularia oryzae]